MRSQQEIVDKIKEVEGDDLIDFKADFLLHYLEFEHAKPWLMEGASKILWGNPMPSDDQSILEEMENYMEFAWDKANNFKGISAARSISHYEIWMWLIGDEEIFDTLPDYEYYGKPILKAICEHYGWDYSKWDDGVRLDEEPELS